MKLIKYLIEVLLAVLYYYPTGIQHTKCFIPQCSDEYLIHMVTIRT